MNEVENKEQEQKASQSLQITDNKIEIKWVWDKARNKRGGGKEARLVQ